VQSDTHLSAVSAKARGFRGSPPYPSFPKYAQQQSHDNADKQAGHDREVEVDVSSSDLNVSRQFSDPPAPDATPQQKSSNDKDNTENNQQLAEFVHDSMGGIYPKAQFPPSSGLGDL
jgi:hypothetical protein